MKTIVVAGFARCGLTLTMQILDAAGLICYGKYPDYEVSGDIPWGYAAGHVVKLVNAIDNMPPTTLDCDYILPRRRIKQQAKSVQKYHRMLTGNELNQKILRKQLRKVNAKLAHEVRNYRSLVFDFEDLIEEPLAVCHFMSDWLGIRTNIHRMASRVKRRSADCYDGMLENQLISVEVNRDARYRYTNWWWNP